MTIRVAGAQIPVTKYIETNFSTIKTALDWAGDNKVDLLVTPEGSLSGYLKSYDEVADPYLQEAAREIASYAASKGICLALGTLYIEKQPFGLVKQSQIRYYNDFGGFVDSYEKQMVIPADEAYPGAGPKIIRLQGITHNKEYNFTVGSFICNDMWGERNGQVIANGNLSFYANSGVNLVCHASNGFRGTEAGDRTGNQKLKEYADIHLWMAARYGVPIITVDNCYNNDGNFYDDETSSTSGIIHNGEWLIRAKSSGTDYFYYDFNF